MSIRITCISKAGGYHEDPHESIQQLGWLNEQNGELGRSSRDQMYDFVSTGGLAVVVAGPYRAKLEARTNSRGTKYVRTVADGTQKDNLLHLPECR